MLLILLLIFSLIGCTDSLAVNGSSRASEGTIIIDIEKGQSTEGKIRVAVFDNKAAFNKSEGPLKGKVINPTDHQLEFSDIPYGTYAIAAYHDLNNNGKLDKNMLGIPTEPYAFSNNPVVKWEAPTYEDAQFNLNQAKLKLNLKLKFWKDY